MSTSAPFQPAFISLPETIALHACARPNDPAFIEGDTTRSWREFNADINRVANVLIADGLEKGDCVAVLGGNSLWAYTMIFGIVRAGGVACPLSSLLTPKLLATLVADCGAKLCLVQEDYLQLAQQTQQLQPDLQLLAEHSDALAQRLDKASDSDPGITLSAENRCNIIYSSGTTGTPKGIVHNHGARVGFATELGFGLRFHSRCRTLLTTPPNSNGTWMIMLPTVMLGGATILMGAFDCERLFANMKAHSPSHAFLVPTQARAVLDHPQHTSADFKSFECVVTAGAPMPEPLKTQVRELTGEKLYELWGFTESVGTIISPAEMAERPQSVGRAWMGSELRIIDEDGSDTTGLGVGEIVGRTISMMEGYLNRDDANADIEWRNDKGQLFFRTGDIGELDEDGYLTLRGRAKDMIISGGLNIFPVDIEAVLLQHPQVQDAAVVGIAHDKWGETPVAFVTTKSGEQPQSSELLDWCNAQLAKFQRISDLVLYPEDFPRNTLGKVLKNELVDSYHPQ